MNLNMLTRAGGTDTEATLSGDVNVTGSEWVKLDGEYLFDEAASGAFVYLYVRNNPTASYLVDDFKVTMIAPPPEVPDQGTITYDFENGDTQSWVPRGSGVQIASVNEEAQTGTYSLKTTNRSFGWHGPSLNVKGILKKGAVYEISGHVKLVQTPEAPSTVKFTMEQRPLFPTQWSPQTSGYCFLLLIY